MIIDSVDTSNLSDNSEEAFVAFEKRLREALETDKTLDRQRHYDRDGYYQGTYAPERFYVSSILAFLDEYNLPLDVSDITELPNNEFSPQFDNFFNKINYAKTRYALRKNRVDSGAAGTPVRLETNYKDEISDAISTIRKIVNQQVAEANKRDSIFNKLEALQLEVDRDKTTIDMLFGRFIDLSKVVRDAAENSLEPVVKKLERISEALTFGTVKIELKLLVDSKERKRLTSSSIAKEDEVIPF